MPDVLCLIEKLVGKNNSKYSVVYNHILTLNNIECKTYTSFLF